MSSPEIDGVRAQLSVLLGRDNVAKGLGISLLDAAPGHASVKMTIRDDHLNFMGWAHGGIIFSFADTAFGLASNSHDKASVGIDAHIAYLSGVREGDEIVASATEINRTRRKAVYRIDVRRPSDDVEIAAFTGTVYVTEKDLDLES